jgi:hypothetical protein
VLQAGNTFLRQWRRVTPETRFGVAHGVLAIHTCFLERSIRVVSFWMRMDRISSVMRL